MSLLWYKAHSLWRGHSLTMVHNYITDIFPHYVLDTFGDAVTKALWSDLGRCIVCQVNNAVQKIAFSLSDRHQIVPGGGGGRHKAFLSAENWKAFIKWLSLVKCLFSFFLSFVFFEEEEEEPPFVSTLNSVSLCSACSSRECWHM